MRPLKRKPLHRKNQPDRWTEEDVKRMLTNPFFTGIRVHPNLTKERPINSERFIELMEENIAAVGPAIALRVFLKGLQEGDQTTYLGVMVHECFTHERPALVTQDEWVHAGQINLQRLGAPEFFRYVLTNLAQGQFKT